MRRLHGNRPAVLIPVDEAYARSYRRLYEHHWWWRARERLLVREIAKRFPPGTSTSILDVGCGDGLFFDALSRFGTVEGVEPAGHLIDEHAPYRDRIHVGPFDRAFQPDHRFGLILMLDVLEHLEDPRGALVHALDLLTPGGHLIVTVPAFPSLWTTHDVLNEHVTRYTRQTFAAMADGAGLRIDASQYFFHWLFAAKLVVRVIEQVLRTEPTPTTLPPPPVNAMLSGLCLLEQAVFARTPLPFGGSLLVVGGRES